MEGNATTEVFWTVSGLFAGCVQAGCFAPVCNSAVFLGVEALTRLVRDAELKVSSIWEEASGPPRTLAG